ncbi:hypothetical protein BH09ACT12_BH09ACT12_33270 [soil metagenome]
MTRFSSAAATSLVVVSLVLGALLVSVAPSGVAASKSVSDTKGDARVKGLDLTGLRAAFGKGRLRLTYTFKSLGDSGWVESLYGPKPFKYADDGFMVSVNKPAGKKPRAVVRRYQEYTGTGSPLRGCGIKRQWQVPRNRVIVSFDADCGLKKVPRALDILGGSAFAAGRGDYSDGVGRFQVRYN